MQLYSVISQSRAPQLSPDPALNSEVSPLPDISQQTFAEILQRLTLEDVQFAMRHRIFPVAWVPGLTLYGVCGAKGRDVGADLNRQVVAQVSPDIFHRMIRAIWGERLIAHVTGQLPQQQPHYSAYRRFSSRQMIGGILILAALIAIYVCLPVRILWMILSLMFGIFFLSVISLKFLCLLPLMHQRAPRHRKIPDSELPAYSVLVPIFKEVAVLHQLLRALQMIDYPADKLDIKIIVEEGDLTMRRAVAAVALPAHFEVIVVPPGTPQTKPRALNYALQFAWGHYVTIYDAEDIPEPDQLRRCAQKFAASPERLVCIQAQLTFFNVRENWITRQFAAEYAVLFEGILPALAEQNLPLPLGGTSNHFKADVLRNIGGWDAFNVTEDADIGFRLARRGFTTAVISSRTYEEANSQIPNWLHQRARWLKGFLQTWAVHTRNPVQSFKELQPAGFWVFTTMTLGVFISALLHPILIISTLMVFVNNLRFDYGSTLISEVIAGLNLVVFVAGYCVCVMAELRALRSLGVMNSFHTLVFLPLYWLLMSVAAWLALWQFIRDPHGWNKTEHGLSKLQQS